MMWRARISLSELRVPRTVFLGNPCVIGTLLVFLYACDGSPVCDALGILPLAIAALGLVLLPFVLYMRLHDCGRSVAWASLPFAGVVMALPAFMSAMGRMGGAYHPDNSGLGDTIQEWTIMIGLGATALLCLYAALATRVPSFHPNEVPQ